MGIVIREANLDSELPLLADMVNSSFGMSISAERFRWLYLDNPDGRAVAWFAIDDRTGAVAGCTAVSPRRVQAGGREVVAWNCGDFSIAVRYRTMGAAVKLRRAARDAIDAGQSAFLYAHPNDRMLAVHLRVGHSPLAKMRRYAKPLQLTTGSTLVNRVGSVLLRGLGREVLVRLRHDIELIESGPFPADIDDVYQRARGRLGTVVVRDRTYLNWRFQCNPEKKTETLITRSSGRASGYVTFAMQQRVLLVKDWLAADEDARDQIFAAVLREARRRAALSATVIALETHPDVPALRRLGFMLRPDASTAVAYASEHHPVRPDVMDASRWYMTSGDRDI